MVEFFRDGDRLVDATALDRERIRALDDDTRLDIIRMLSEEPGYPADLAERLGISKQKAYYHFEKLKEADLIEKTSEKKMSGGVANLYQPVKDGMVLDLGSGGRKVFKPDKSESVENFLDPLISEGTMNGRIVVGSPDQHGPDQVRARDGHLSAEIAMKLGSFCSASEEVVVLDTEVVRDDLFDQNLVLLGGILTNTAMKKFNSEFMASFTGESFPYHEISTSRSSYTDENVGLVAKTDNPNDDDKAIYSVAGIRSSGTRAAAKAFRDLGELVEGYSEGDFYAVVRGIDLDGDGKIDDYEVLESSIEGGNDERQ